MTARHWPADTRLAERVRMLRQALGLSGERLGARVDLHAETIYRIEQSRRTVSVGEAINLAGALGVDLCDLIALEPLDVRAALGEAHRVTAVHSGQGCA